MDKILKNKPLLWSLGGIILIAIIAIAAYFILANRNQVMYTITFDTDGGSEVTAIKAADGKVVTLTTEVTKEGYTFNGWLDAEGKSVNLEYVVTSDVTLKANWLSAAAETITITFDSNGGTAVDSMVIEMGSSLVLPANPTKKGYTFSHWQDFNEIPISDGANLGEDITLYAIWDKVETTEPSPSAVEVSGVSFDKDTLNMIINNTEALHATVSPSNASNQTLTWASSNANVIRVDNGAITAVGLGSATITATSANGKSASILVKSDVRAISIQATRTAIAYNGERETVLTLTIDSNGYNVTKDMIAWSVPSASGQYGSITAIPSSDNQKMTITARSTNVFDSAKVTATVGNVSAQTVITVEGPLAVSTYSDNAVSCNSAVTSCTATGDDTLSLYSNIAVTWVYIDSDIIVNKDTSRDSQHYLKLYVQYVLHSGLNIKANTAGGQSHEIILDLVRGS